MDNAYNHFIPLSRQQIIFIKINQLEAEIIQKITKITSTQSTDIH